MFGVAHFVHLATALSAVAAVLPLLPVATVALPAVLELFLVRGQPLKALALAALHIGAYTVGGRSGPGHARTRAWCCRAPQAPGGRTAARGRAVGAL